MVFRERSSEKTVSFEELIMPKDKYNSTFLKINGGDCHNYPLNIFRNTYLHLKLGYSPVKQGHNAVTSCV